MSLKGKTFFITGASRGIGKAIALRLAKEGAQIAVIAKSVKEDPRLPGTIYTAARAIEEAGGEALPVACDIRDEEQILQAVQKTIQIFGGIDGLVNNASAINLTDTENIQTKRYDLMYQINVRGTFLVTKHCIPFLKKSNNAHIVTMSPPLDFHPEWFAQYGAYAVSKFNMSMFTIGWAQEYKDVPIAANTLWPKTTIATAAVKNLLGGDALMQRSRKPEIVADAVHWIMSQPSASCTGNMFTDEEILQKTGITDFSPYSFADNSDLQKDLFIR